jgi:hypothetical protein
MRRGWSVRKLLLAAAPLVAGGAVSWEFVTAAAPRHGTETAAVGTTVARGAPRRPPRARAAPPVIAAENPEADPSAPEEASAVPEAPRCVLRIVDSEGRRLEGVRVEWVRARGSDEDTTDANGEVSRAVPVGGATPRAEVFDGWEQREVVLVDPVTTLVVAHLPELELIVVDGSTGRALEAPEVEMETWTNAAKHTWKFAPGDGVHRRLSVASDREIDVNVSVRAPAGFGAVRRIDWEGKVAVQAEKARVVVPVFPAETWTLRLRDAEGRPAAGVSAGSASLAAVYGAESTRGWGAEFDPPKALSSADGILVLPGIPRIPVNAASLDVRRYPDRENGVVGLRGTLRIPLLDVAAPREPVEIELRRWNGGSSYQGGCSSSFG